jgi:hypothetical protein
MRLMSGTVVFDFIRENAARELVEMQLRQVAAILTKSSACDARCRFDPATCGEDAEVVAQIVRRTDYMVSGARALHRGVIKALSRDVDRRDVLRQADFRFHWDPVKEAIEIF